MSALWSHGPQDPNQNQVSQTKTPQKGSLFKPRGLFSDLTQVSFDFPRSVIQGTVSSVGHSTDTSLLSKKVCCIIKNSLGQRVDGFLLGVTALADFMTLSRVKGRLLIIV